MNWPGVIQAYRSFLPISDLTPVITLLEGNTPLIPVPGLVRKIGGNFSLYLKYEALNPTCSFKDRGMTLAISKAAEKGAKVVVCASTGNTSAAAAAYAARAGMKAVVILPHGKIAMGKLAQALIYGASIIPIDGNFDEALRVVRELGELNEIEVVNSINPVRIEGQKTAAFEICDVLAHAPDYHFIPVGNAGNITAYWKGFNEYKAAGKIMGLPKMMGWQAAGSAPIVDDRIIENPNTVATAIRIGNPASWQGAKAAAQESGGSIGKVTDEEILEAYRLLASTEGLFVEPACAAPLAGLIKTFKAGGIPDDAVITATMTGHGLKDPDTAIGQCQQDLTPIKASKEAVLRAIGL
ncbi:MAG: threonine synthase [Blastochloris sp.]|nr:threonine synthase [Blastochloris sp.]